MAKDWNRHAIEHMIDIEIDEMSRDLIRGIYACAGCKQVAPFSARWCPSCGYHIGPDVVERTKEAIAWLRCLREGLSDRRCEDNYIFPTAGVYICYHPHEKYKIGKGEKIVQRRIPTHQCAAPSLRLLHVIETSDLDWCERFLHGRFRHRRIFPNHEYFDLTKDDLEWLFSIKVLEPPRSEAMQHSLLDLL